MRLALVVLALAPRASVSVCHRLLVFHSSHEGSHALALAISVESGAFDLGESLDVRYVRAERTPSVWNAAICDGALDALYAQGDAEWRMPLIAMKKFRSMFDRLRSIRCDDPSNVQATVTLLVRNDHLRTLTACVRQTPLAPRLNFVDVLVLVRRDLMRWSLAAYGRHDPNSRFSLYPQFEPEPTPGAPTQRFVYNLTALHLTAVDAVKAWQHKAIDVCRLLAAGFSARNVHFVSYEAFARNPRAVAQLVAAPLNGTRLTYRERAPFERTRKVHPHDISAFAANADDVRRLFWPGGRPAFPTFEKVLRSVGARQRAACPQLWPMSSQFGSAAW
ncbi:hypothetical protein KFE25_001365 [Diacronema lutheri]|uniref:Hexosyltransferase n=1 Tax=Diacronema lutheri TaxID=2081491 RepID=A0A8J5XIG8_DIALT|nr:hypothetical protein KFE25_001365 [Diacronema lutheri]